jgi:hypothetical protein
MIRKIKLFLIIILSLHLYAVDTDFKQYEKDLNLTAIKNFKKNIEKNLKKFGIPLGKKDFDKYISKMKKKYEKEINKKLKSQYKAYIKDNVPISKFYADEIQLKKKLDKISQKSFSDVLNMSITQELGVKGLTGFWKCCCGAFIAKNLNQISKTALPIIAKETAMVKKSFKNLKQILDVIKKRADEKKFNKGLYGQTITENFLVLYSLSPNVNTVRNIDKLRFLENKNLKILQNTIELNNKEIYVKDKKDAGND